MKPDAKQWKHRARRGMLAVCGALGTLFASASMAADAARPAFTESELKAILSHGPYPAPAPLDPTNRASGNREAIDLGVRLFFDERLSGGGKMSCATCHVPERNWTDNERRSVGAVELDRNTPTLTNLIAGRWYGWDGAADSLWSQSLRPILDKRELGATMGQVAKLLRSDNDLACRYRKAFGAAPSSSDDEGVLVNVSKALAAFQETISTGRTVFDRFRDALAKGAPPSTWNYSEAAQRGVKLFVGKGGCTNCHAGPNFTNGEFFSTGLSRHAPQGKPDAGRPEGIRQLLESRFNLLGPYNDDKTGKSAVHTREVSATKVNLGEFKVPTLRNLMLTQPYGRDGQVDTLAEVVRHYATVDPIRLHAKDGMPAKPLKLTAAEQSDLVVFLESLSTFSNPWRPEETGHCQ